MLKHFLIILFQNNSKCAIVNMDSKLSKLTQHLSNSSSVFQLKGSADEEQLISVALDARKVFLIFIF
jgi:hypothetical protein